METPPKNSKEVGPVLAICFGIFGLVAGSVILRNGITGVMAGKTHTIGKGTHYLVIKQDTPGEFWFWIGAHFYGAILVFAGAICFFVYGLRRIWR